jgi:quinol-cytochrome oxidoreductase complex cytochrome b subunit
MTSKQHDRTVKVLVIVMGSVHPRNRPVLHLLFWLFISNFLFLFWIGANPIAQPYILIGQISTAIYFLYFVILMIIGRGWLIKYFSLA